MHLGGFCTLLSLAGLAFLCQHTSAAPNQQVPKSTGEVRLDWSNSLYNTSILNVSSDEVPFQEKVPVPDQQNLNPTPKANKTVTQALESTKTSLNVGPTTIWPVTDDFFLIITIGGGVLPEDPVDALLSSAYRTAEKKASSALLTEKYENRIRSRLTRALDIVLDVEPFLGTMNWEDFSLAITGLWEFYHRMEDPPPQPRYVYFEAESRERGSLGLGTLRHGYNSLPPLYGAADGKGSNTSLTS